MDKEQFFNLIKRQDLHILEVTETPYPVYESLISDSGYKDYVFAKVHSERYKEPCFICVAVPFGLDHNTMNKGLARELAARFMTELYNQEAERAKSERVI